LTPSGQKQPVMSLASERLFPGAKGTPDQTERQLSPLAVIQDRQKAPIARAANGQKWTFADVKRNPPKRDSPVGIVELFTKLAVASSRVAQEHDPTAKLSED